MYYHKILDLVAIVDQVGGPNKNHLLPIASEVTAITGRDFDPAEIYYLSTIAAAKN